MNNDSTNPTMRTSRIEFPIDGNQKNSILNKKTLLATLFGAGGAVAFVSAKDLLNNNTGDAGFSIENPEEADCYASIELNESVAESNSELSFGDAFEIQRELQGPGGIFLHNGKYYNTYLKEEWDGMSDHEKDNYFAGISDKIDYSGSKIIEHQNGELVEINIDQDAEPEITLTDSNHDGVLEVDQVDLNNDGNVDVIHDTISNNSEGDSPLDMEIAAFKDLEDLEEPEEMIVEPEQISILDNQESIIIDEGDILAPDSSEEADMTEDLTEIEVDSDITDPSIGDGDLLDPSVDLIDEGDMVDPTIESIEDGDMVDPSSEVMESGDLADPSFDNEDINDLPDLISDLDMSEFDF